MAGVFEKEINGVLTTRLTFDFADDNGHELRIQYTYRKNNRRMGYLELWRTDHNSKNNRIRAMSELLEDVFNYKYDYLTDLKYAEQPDVHKVVGVLDMAREVIGANFSDGRWRIPEGFDDINLFSGFFTDCNGNKYRFDRGRSAKVHADLVPRQTAETDQADTDDEDCPPF